MRHKERIPIFLELVDLTKLEKRWTVGGISPFPSLPDMDFKQFLLDHTNLSKYWLENPDQRFGQVLINLGLTIDGYFIWNDEEDCILFSQGVEPREFTFWTSLFDKDGNRLKEPITKLIKDLETNHIENILISECLHLSNGLKKILENELDLRKEIKNLI